MELSFWFAAAALIVAAVGAVVGPLLVTWYQHRTAAALAEKTEILADKTHDQLNAIHLLVNSNLVRAQRRELTANQVALQSMREVVAIKEASGVPVLSTTRGAIDRLEEQTAQLEQEILTKTKLFERHSEVPPSSTDQA